MNMFQDDDIQVSSSPTSPQHSDSFDSDGGEPDDDDSIIHPGNPVEAWIRNSALLGDSVTALCFSALLLTVSIILSLSLRVSSSSPNDSLGPIPTIDPPRIFHIQGNSLLSGEMEEIVDLQILNSYKKDGVVAIRGLLSDDTLDRLDHEGNVFIQHQFDKKKSRSRGLRNMESSFKTTLNPFLNWLSIHQCQNWHRIFCTKQTQT
jgi:hypothetical protein